MNRLKSFSISSVGLSLIFAGMLEGGLPFQTLSQTTRPKPSAPSTTAQAIPAPLKDGALVPGVRVGPITATTSYQDLVRIFGAERLKDVRPPDADDTEREHGTRIDLGSTWSLTVVWQDKTKMKPYQTIDMGPGWKFPEGLRLGMPLAELKQKVGTFQIIGLGGPYAGIIPLTNVPKLKPYFGKIIIQMAPVKDAKTKFPQNYKALEGEYPFPSDNPNWKPLDLSVKYLIFLFPRGEVGGGTI